MKKGFTLAEILIALGVVGVVAVLSVPSMMKNYKNRVYTSQLQKVYSQISSATSAIMSDEKVDNFYETKGGTATNTEKTIGLPYFFNNYFKLSKSDCGSATATEPCISHSGTFYKNLNGQNIPGYDTSAYCVQTVNDAVICGFYNPAISCTTLMVDVNGMDAPNVAGRDIFSMDIHRDGSLSDYGSGCYDGGFGCTADKCSKGHVNNNLHNWACGCLTSVIEAGWKMEY